MDVKELFNQGKFKEVISLLKKSTDVGSQEMLAFAYQKTAKWEEAMQIWTTLIAMYPENAAFYNERGVCKFQLRFKHAIQDFNAAIRLDPAEPYYYSCRAYIRDKIGDIEGAIADYSTAHDLDPSDAITLNNLGLAEQKFGHTQKARERFKDSDDLLGIKTIDSLPEVKPKFESIPPPKPTIWAELKNMISSKSGFKSFLKDLGVIKK
jgi:tetratricopeptide (TPR) repeat protein